MIKKSLLVLTVAIISLCLPSCKNTSEEAEGGTSGKTEHAQRVVTLVYNEDNAAIGSGSINYAEDTDGKKVIGINIMKETADGYEPFAYGLFDGSQAISAVLEEGDKYTIECVELKNSEDTLYHEGAKYYEPFLSNNKPVELMNTFTYSSTESFDSIAMGKFAAYVKTVNNSKRRVYLWNPSAYTYFGIVEGFDPSTSGSITLNLKRAVFGLNFIVTPPGDGSAEISYLNKAITIANGDETYNHESIFSFSDIINGSEDGYSTKIRMISTWTRSNGNVERDTISVPVTRNNITTVELNYSGPKSEGFNINEESGIMTRDTVRWTFGKK